MPAKTKKQGDGMKKRWIGMREHEHDEAVAEVKKQKGT